MRPIKFSYTPADDDTNGYLAGATLAGPFTPDATTSADSLAHLFSITSTANLSGITFTVTGTDADGLTQTEDITGPNNTTVYGTKYFMSVTSISASSTLGASTADFGWKDVCIGPTIPLDWKQNSFLVSLAANITGTINYTVQHTLDRLASGNPSTFFWLNHSSLASKTADADGNYAAPIIATRLLINSLTAGATIDFYIVQGS